ncbi:MAG: acyltransferase [Pseudomonadales bacterium]|nr:acyltransferase [Pseudomonadales bacterium]
MTISAYRPDIDGLRSIAVLLVVIFHAGFDFIPGGFIGVDVFFVLSGYLITTILFREISDKTFSFSSFYQRRIRRLMPALFSVLLVVSVFSVVFLLPSDLVSYAKSLFFTALSLSNMYFWRENGGYFEGNTQEVPLLHTWSLSVEEQYYVIWPIYLIVCAKLFPKRWLVILTAILFIASLFFSEWVTRVAIGASYYLLPTRIFELLIGSGLALVWSRLPDLNRATNSVLSLVGLSLIVWSAFYLSKNHGFPGFNALYPACGAGLLLISGRGSAGIVNQILSCRPFVWIGLISYSLYLWHWPIIVFVHYIGVEFTATISLFIIAISIFIAWLNWRFIETRYRYIKGADFKRTIVKLFILPLALISIFSIIIVATNGLPSRFSSKVVQMQNAIDTRPSDLRKRCHSPSRDSDKQPMETCRLGNADRAIPNVLMLGDSHANHFTGFVDELAKRSGDAILDYTLDGCLPIFDFIAANNQHFAQLCDGRNNISRNYIASNSFEKVILSGQWPVVIEAEGTTSSESGYKLALSVGLQRTIKAIISSGAQPIIIKNGARANTLSPKCPITKILYNESIMCDLNVVDMIQENIVIESIFDELAAQFPELLLIDPKEVMCGDKVCYSELDDVPLYLDGNHLNDIGSRVIAKHYLKALGNPFISKGEMEFE